MKQRSTQSENRLVRRFFVLVFVVVLLRSAIDGGDTIIATDDQGSEWEMTSAKGPSLRSLLDRKVKPGPPLTVGARARRQGSSMLLDLVIKGQAGETYRPSIVKDGKHVRSSVPSFTVVDRLGKVVGSGKFEFG
jgi:hypothetical protein